MFTTRPRLSPLDSESPNPMTSSSPASFISVMRQQIFVVPMSSPTMILSLAAMYTPVPEHYLVITPQIHNTSFRRIQFCYRLDGHSHLHRCHLAKGGERYSVCEPEGNNTTRFDEDVAHLKSFGLNQ